MKHDVIANILFFSTNHLITFVCNFTICNIINKKEIPLKSIAQCNYCKASAKTEKIRFNPSK